MQIVQALGERLLRNVQQVIVGKDQEIRLTLLAIWRGVIGVYNSEDLTFASSIAYYTLLSLFPFFLLALSILSSVTSADSDRAAVATVLGRHMSAGRLTMDEYDERLARAYAAKTYGELAEITADLPSTDVAPRPAAAPSNQPSSAVAHGGWDADPHSWRSWVTTSLIVLTIWAATSLATWEFLYFWPIWVIGPWGAVLLAQQLTRRDDDGDGRYGRPRRRFACAVGAVLSRRRRP